MGPPPLPLWRRRPVPAHPLPSPGCPRRSVTCQHLPSIRFPTASTCHPTALQPPAPAIHPLSNRQHLPSNRFPKASTCHPTAFQPPAPAIQPLSNRQHLPSNRFPTASTCHPTAFQPPAPTSAPALETPLQPPPPPSQAEPHCPPTPHPRDRGPLWGRLGMTPFLRSGAPLGPEPAAGVFLVSREEGAGEGVEWGKAGTHLLTCGTTLGPTPGWGGGVGKSPQMLRFSSRLATSSDFAPLTKMHQSPSAQSSLCAQAPLLPRGVPPAPAPAVLHEESLPRQ